MQLDTDPPFCVVPSGSYLQKKSGKAIKYYKVLRFKDRRRHYVCSLTEEELERIKSGYPAYKLLCEKASLASLQSRSLPSFRSLRGNRGLKTS